MLAPDYDIIIVGTGPTGLGAVFKLTERSPSLSILMIDKEKIMGQTADTRQNRLKDLLMKEKRRLWNELRIENLAKTGESLNKQYDFPLDSAERSVLALLADTGLALADIQGEKLTLLDNALLKLNSNSYGICDGCGKEIDEARLQILPYAAFCTVCQQQREASGNRSVGY